tara:strand:- start:870 stop:1283 length:414 start_codon:yes stop_codon:yes gene_type:complete
MGGFSGFGNSPLKKEYSLSDPVPTDRKVSPKVNSKKTSSKSKSTSTLQGYASDISGLQSNLTKKHTLYKDKKLTLKGQVNMPKANIAWNSGSPTVNLTNSANLSGKYKIGKNTTLGGSVSFTSGKTPRYSAGLKINI